MRKITGYAVPIVLTAALLAISLSSVHVHKHSGNMGESSVSSSDTAIQEEKKGTTRNFVLKDPAVPLEQQSDEVNENSATDESNKLEDIINVITESTKD